MVNWVNRCFGVRFIIIEIKQMYKQYFGVHGNGRA